MAPVVLMIVPLESVGMKTGLSPDLDRNVYGVNAGVGLSRPSTLRKIRCLLVDAPLMVPFTGCCGTRAVGANGLPVLKRAVVALQEAPPVQHVGSRFGQNLDAPVADAVELRRKRILIDADLADRRLGRQCARR